MIHLGIVVWDPVVRALHWALAAMVALTYWSGAEYFGIHVWGGYAAMLMIAVRIAWGFVGPTHARFSDFLAGPRGVALYLHAPLTGHARRYLGHNPAGGAMILLLILVLLLVTLSGVALDAAENRAGPLGGTRLFLHLSAIETAHILSANTLLVLVALHVAGVLHASALHRENLVWSMISGRKRI